MPNENNKPKTIHFAGRDLDRNDFVRLAQSKANQWMDYQMLQGDERTDFMNSFQEVLQGVVDGKYTTSEFGKIHGIPEEENYYKERNGQRTDGKGGFLSSRRVGFNPYTNVQTYLIGVANQLTPKKDKSLKEWNSNTLRDIIGTSIFGEGNQQDPTKNPEQLLAWANQYDPLNDGKRDTAGRQGFIEQELKKYAKALNNGEYDISDEDKVKELDRINALSNGASGFELGKIAPWMSHYMFTGERYMTQEEKDEVAATNKNNAYLNNTGTNPYSFGTQEYNTSIDTKKKYWLDHLSQYLNNQTQSYGQQLLFYDRENVLDADNINKAKNLSIDNFLKIITNTNQPFEFRSEVVSEYLKHNAKLINNTYYLPSWNKGLLITATKSNNQYILNFNAIKDAFNSGDSSLQTWLANSYLKYNKITDISYKQGGVLKARLGTNLLFNDNDLLNDPDKPGSNNPSTNNSSTTQPNTGSTAGVVGSNLLTGTLGDSKTPEDTEIPENGETGRIPGKEYNISPTDRYITWLENRKLNLAKWTNQMVYNIMNGIRNFHVSPPMEHYKQYTDKPLEDYIAKNNADFNRLGNIAASGTSDQGAGHAYNINYQRQAASANAPLISKQADDTRASIDKENEVAQKNNLYRHEAGEKNRQSDIALWNTRRHMLAELFSKNGALDVNNIMSRQYGTALNAERNYNRDKLYAIQNDSKVKTLQSQVDALTATCYENPSDEEAKRNLRITRLQLEQAKQAAADCYDTEHLAPTGTPYAGYGYIFGKQTPNPVPTVTYKKGGKVGEGGRAMYERMLHDLMTMNLDHHFKTNRDAYAYYRKLMMQSK